VAIESRYGGKKVMQSPITQGMFCSLSIYFHPTTNSLYDICPSQWQAVKWVQPHDWAASNQRSYQVDQQRQTGARTVEWREAAFRETKEAASKEVNKVKVN